MEQSIRRLLKFSPTGFGVLFYLFPCYCHCFCFDPRQGGLLYSEGVLQSYLFFSLLHPLLSVDLGNSYLPNAEKLNEINLTQIVLVFNKLERERNKRSERSRSYESTLG